MQKTVKRVLALVLAMIMAMSVFSIAASAVNTDYRADYQSTTHTVFKHTEETLAPGVEFYTNYAYSSDNKQMVYYVTTADVNRDDVVCQVSYKDMQCDTYGMSKLSEQVSAANAKFSDPENSEFISENYAVVSATNGDGYNMTTGEPGGCLVMNGKVKKTWTQNASSSMFFAILNDGRAVISDSVDEWNAYMADPGIKEAIDSFGTSAKLVWDGEDVTASASGTYNTDRHSRTMFGVTADGKVVQAVLDGRQEPFSCGGSMHELAQIMIEAGCVRAFNCDGGGSTTFMARMPGEETAQVINRPSDGSPRSISNGMIIATTAKVKDEVAYVNYTPEAEYITPGTSINISTVAYDEDNSVIMRPSGLTYEVTGGTFENGVFTAPDEVGDVTITAVFNGNNVSEQVIHVVYPDSLTFNEYEAFYERLGSKTPISFTATYNGGDVKFKPEDFELTVTNTTAGHEGETVGSFDGFLYVAPADTEDNQARYQTGTLTATIKGTDISATNAVKFTDTYVLSQGFETGGRYSDPVEAYNQTVDTDLVTSEYVTAETGKVHGGNRSLAINIDFTGVAANGYGTGYMAVRQRLTALSTSYGKKFGLWMYIPERIDAAFIRIFNGSANLVNLIDTGNLHHEKYDEGAWHYFEGDISGQQSFSYAFLEIYVSDRDGTEDDYYFADATNVNKKFTLYIDDIGFDRTYGGYDMQDPIFSGVTAYTTSGGSSVDLGYQDIPDINASTVSITADVDDDRQTNPYTVSGLDYSSAKAYIDGVQVDASAVNNTITIEDIALSKGIHTARFEIKDNEGCEAIIVRQFNITAGDNSALRLVSETDMSEKVNIGSVHWFDLVAEDISTVESADVVLDLDCFSHWQDKRIETAEGFTHTATVDDETNTLALHVEKGEGTPQSNVLARIPVKVWEYPGTTYTSEELFSSKCFWPTSIEIKPVKTVAALIDGSQTTFSFANIRIDSEIDGNYAKLLEEGYFDDGKTSWHQHTLEWIDEPTDATCTHPGTNGTAYCSVCDDLVYYDEPVPGVHHYQWDIDQQQYICIDCGKQADELPTIEAAGTVGTFSDGVVESGWVITQGEENNIFYLKDGAKVKTTVELPMYDGSGTKRIKFSSSSPYYFTGLFTGAVNVADYTCDIYEDGVLSTGEGDHMVFDGSKYWIVNAAGQTAYSGTAVGFYVYEGLTYCVYYSKTSTLQSTLNGGLWTGPLNYAQNTTATTDNYYIRGVQIEGWTCVSGAAYDADGNLVTGWRNADGTPAVVDINDPETLIGKYCFGTDGKVKVGSSVVSLTDDTSENRYCSFGTKTSYVDNIGECKGFVQSKTLSGGIVYMYGIPEFGTTFYNNSYYTYLLIDGVKATGVSSGIVPARYSDGYYYNIKSTTGYVVSQYRLTSNFFSPDYASYNLGMDPYYIEARYTGVVDDTTNDKHGYAIFGELFEGYTLTDGKVCDENGDPINRTFFNGFGDQVYYVDGVFMTQGETFIYEGKAYIVVDAYGKALPYNGIFDNKFYIDGIDSGNAIYADMYVVKDGKVCYVNDDGSIGDPVTGMIGDTYFDDGIATEYQIFEDRIIKDGDYLYLITAGGQKGELFSGIFNDIFYLNGVSTDYQVIDGKYVFIDGTLYNVTSDGTLGARVSGTVDGTKYASGKPQNGWVGDKYYYVSGQKVTGIKDIDGKAYKFDDDGLLEGPYNGMLYDESADVYRMYDQGVRKNGSDEFGSCVDGVPNDGWYASEYYFVDGKYLTGIQLVDGFYYDFGEDGSSSPFNKHTGLFEMDGDYYYAVLGALVTGWMSVGDDYYYFSPTDYKAVDGTRRIDGLTYTFVNYILTEGVWLEPHPGQWLYMWAGRGHIAGWDTIDGNIYLFNGNGYAYTGIKTTPHFDNETGERDFVFDDHGAWMSDYTGLYDIGDVTYYVEDGFSVGGGLRLIDGEYYYFKSNRTAVKNTEYFISLTNGLMDPGTYTFDENGVMQVGGTEPDPEAENGIVNENGTLYYYVDGVKQDIGLFQYEGEYYYSRTGGALVKDCTYFISRTNDLLPAGTYTFDENGVMQVGGTEPDPEAENGIVNENGTLYYYVDGVKQDIGLFQYEGEYYYSRTGGALVKDCTYFISRTNGLLPAGTYTFDENGVMQVGGTEPDPEAENGIVNENGTLYYYVDGVKQDIGLFEYEGNYYYSRTGGALVKDCTYFISRTNDLLPAGTYTFDENGVMQVGGTEPEPDPEAENGIVDENGTLYYYVDGVKQDIGLFEYEGNYYYSRTGGALVKDCTYFISRTNGLMDPDTYTFDANGVMQVD